MARTALALMYCDPLSSDRGGDGGGKSVTKPVEARSCRMNEERVIQHALRILGDSNMTEAVCFNCGEMKFGALRNATIVGGVLHHAGLSKGFTPNVMP